MIEDSARVAASWFASLVAVSQSELNMDDIKEFEGNLTRVITAGLREQNDPREARLLLATSERFGDVEMLREAARASSPAVRTAVLSLPPALACIWVSPDKVSVSSWLHNPETIYSATEEAPEAECVDNTPSR